MSQITSHSLLQKAAVSFQAGDYKQALIYCERAISLDPSLASARCNRGIILKKLGRYEEALLAYDRSIILVSDYAITHYNRGLVLQVLGRIDEALSAFDEAIKFEPQYAEAYSAKGVCYKKTGEFSKAIKAVETALKIKPEQPIDKYLLAMLDQLDAPPKSPNEYVTELFDDYASSFDDDLTVNLTYRAPNFLFEAVKQCCDVKNKKLDIIDLGCGTGLCGSLFKELANKLVGVDLSTQMLAKAKQKKIYTELIHTDILHAIKQSKNNYDLVLSADVFIYVGDLKEIFENVKEKLNLGGLFAFSIELSTEGKEYTLRSTGRYAQSLSYIQSLVKRYELEILSKKSVVIRFQEKVPVNGMIFVLEKVPSIVKK